MLAFMLDYLQVIYQSNNNCKVTIKSLDCVVNKGVDLLYDGSKWVIINLF